LDKRGLLAPTFFQEKASQFPLKDAGRLLAFQLNLYARLRPTRSLRNTKLVTVARVGPRRASG